MNSNNIEELFNEATKESDKKNSRIPKLAKILLSSIGIVLIFALIVAKLRIKPQEFVDLSQSLNLNEEKILIESFKDLKYPIKLPSWAKEPFENSILEKENGTYRELTKFASGLDNFYYAIGHLPSKETGNYPYAPPAYTNNLDEEIIDGELNPYFAYAIKEDYAIAYAMYINRLINPVFGNWIYSQVSYPPRVMSTTGDFKSLRNMFSSDWWEENIVKNNYSNLPILADWEGTGFNSQSYEERVFDKLGFWYGEIAETEDNYIEVETLGYDERNTPIIKIKTPIEYTAFNNLNEKIKTKRNLILTFGSNPETHMYNRVIILEAELSISEEVSNNE